MRSLLMGFLRIWGHSGPVTPPAEQPGTDAACAKLIVERSARLSSPGGAQRTQRAQASPCSFQGR
jgi:hypothetical protein